MKTCSKGHGEYSEDRRKCPTCQKEYRRDYHQRNEERARQNNKAWEGNNLEKHLTYHKEYRKAHSEKRAIESRQWFKERPSRPPYNAMMYRCTNPKSQAWKDYGGRGIKVCERWQGKDGFNNFQSDVGPRPSMRHTLDRYPNNNGNYEPGNVRWATMDLQGKNRRKVGTLQSFTTEELAAEISRRAATAETSGTNLELVS